MLGWKGGEGQRYLGKNIGLNAGLVSGEGLTHEVTESEKSSFFSCVSKAFRTSIHTLDSPLTNRISPKEMLGNAD